MNPNPSQRLSLPLSGEQPPRPAVDLPAPPPDAPLEERVIAALHTCFDPEIPVDVYDLGLIYDLQISPSGEVQIRMTLTSPACPVAGALPEEVRSKVASVPGVTAAKVDLVWEPPWDKSRMSEAAALQLGLFD